MSQDLLSNPPVCSYYCPLCHSTCVLVPYSAVHSGPYPSHSVSVKPILLLDTKEIVVTIAPVIDLSGSEKS